MWPPNDSHVHSASFRMAREGMLDPGEKPPGGADSGTRSLHSGRRDLGGRVTPIVKARSGPAAHHTNFSPRT